MINPDFTVMANFCPNGDTKKCENSRIHGTWQAYYDQAFMVHLDNDLRFTANFRYEVKPEVTKDPLNFNSQILEELVPDIEEAAKSYFNSKCDETMIGFVANKAKPAGTLAEHPITCFFAEKDKTQLYEDIVAVQHKQDMNLAQATKQTKLRHKGKKTNKFHTHEASKSTDEYITWLNQQDLPWKANKCMLTHGHPDRKGCEDHSLA